MDEPQAPPPPSARPSGIPRTSRLPVLNKRPSLAGLPKRDNETALPSESNDKPRLQKRSSIASLSRSTTTSSAVKDPIVPLKGTAAQAGLKQPSKGSTAPRIAPRPSSRGNQQRRPPSPRKALITTEDEENHDQLSSLDSFRSASRQGLHDESPVEILEVPAFSATPKGRKSSRPSLSDRTIESLQNVPTTPKDRRRSSFFSPVESPMGPPPRPASSLSRNRSDRSSRPGTSDGSFSNAIGRASISTAKPASSSAKPASRTSLGGFGFTPRTTSRLPSASKPMSTRETLPPQPRSPSPSKRAAIISRPGGFTGGKVTGSKTVGARTPKPRPALSDAFGAAVRAGTKEDSGTIAQGASDPAAAPAPGAKRAVSNPSNPSSTALRQQIAAARAAAKKEKAKHDSPQKSSVGAGVAFGTEIDLDPFNQNPRDEKHILRNRINTARMDGKLNIAALGLKEVPDAVMTMYDPTAMEESGVSWAEVVDLTRLNAADNEIVELADRIFPDVSAEDFAADDDTAGNQFGGLEALDLHGNHIHALPVGLRRLERLTTLNLSHNKLENGALDVISQISSLHEIRLGHNALSGSLSSSICNLQSLETLDLQSNRLLGLPEAIRELVSLRVLNVSGNQLTTLPVEALQELRLSELDVSRNAVVGPLFGNDTASGHPTLQVLNVSNNSLAGLTFAESLNLPQLRTLDVTNNHLTSLPLMSSWTELITLMCGDNKLKEIPDGFATLRKLRNVNLSGNDIRLLDPEIGKMESLEGLILSSNPLRDKKFLTMNSHDIKRDLRARLEPQNALDADETEMQAQDSQTGSPVKIVSSPTASWTLKANGILDLSGKGLSDSVNDILGSFLQAHEVTHLNLSNNKLTAVPPALWLGHDLRVLDLSGNSLGSDYLSDELELPMLQEMKLSRCSITTLEPLLTQLQAPKLLTVDLTANRLTGAVPHVRESYPALTTLFAGDNKFSTVSADALRGLQTVNLQSNNLEQLPAEIGLLWDQGLRNFEVGSNAFRVPSYRVLEKGTEALMKWLRNKIPGAVGDED